MPGDRTLYWVDIDPRSIGAAELPSSYQHLDYGWVVNAEDPNSARSIVEWWTGRDWRGRFILPYAQARSFDTVPSLMVEKDRPDLRRESIDSSFGWQSNPLTEVDGDVSWIPRQRVLALFFDGTRNQIKAGSPDQLGSNVLRLYRALSQKDGPFQFAFYHPGPGTLATQTSTAPGRWMERAGDSYSGTSGVERSLLHGYNWLMNTWRPGDRVHLYGFSRGAYTARAFAALLATVGLPRPGHENLTLYSIRSFWKNFKRLENARRAPRSDSRSNIPDDDLNWMEFKKYITNVNHIANGFTHQVEVDFMGLWEAVSAIGWLPSGHETPLMSHTNVHVARHALALDEIRRSYQPEHLPSLRNSALARKKWDLEQELLGHRRRLHRVAPPEKADFQSMWFAGFHSDIGGDPKDRRPADIPLEWIASEAEANSLRIDHHSESLGNLRPFWFEDNQIVHRDMDKDSSAEMASGPLNPLPSIWRLTSWKHRTPQSGHLVHASVNVRIGAGIDYQLPRGFPKDLGFGTSRTWPQPGVSRKDQRWWPGGVNSPETETHWADFLAGVPDKTPEAAFEVLTESWERHRPKGTTAGDFSPKRPTVSEARLAAAQLRALKSYSELATEISSLLMKYADDRARLETPVEKTMGKVRPRVRLTSLNHIARVRHARTGRILRDSLDAAVEKQSNPWMELDSDLVDAALSAASRLFGSGRPEEFVVDHSGVTNSQLDASWATASPSDRITLLNIRQMVHDAYPKCLYGIFDGERLIGESELRNEIEFESMHTLSGEMTPATDYWESPLPTDDDVKGKVQPEFEFIIKNYEGREIPFKTVMVRQQGAGTSEAKLAVIGTYR